MHEYGSKRPYYLCCHWLTSYIASYVVANICSIMNKQLQVKPLHGKYFTLLHHADKIEKV